MNLQVEDLQRLGGVEGRVLARLHAIAEDHQRGVAFAEDRSLAFLVGARPAALSLEPGIEVDRGRGAQLQMEDVLVGVDEEGVDRLTGLGRALDDHVTVFEHQRLFESSGRSG